MHQAQAMPNVLCICWLHAQVHACDLCLIVVMS